MPDNQAAWVVEDSSKPLYVASAPYTQPGENQLVIRARAVAINPVDWAKQIMGSGMLGYIKYPFVLGSDVAGEVVELGPGVTRFKVGDRVLGHAAGMDPRSAKAAESAFQEYVVLRTSVVSRIPDTVSYADASVVPLGLSTAATGLYQKGQLGLEHPSVTPKSNGQILLIWGASTSVGSNAVQLAVASGYEVIATASPKNFEKVKKLGASHVFDYRSKTVIKDIASLLNSSGKESVGALAVGDGSLEACISIIAATKNGRKFVAQASFTMGGAMPTTKWQFMMGVPFLMWSNVSTWFQCLITGVKTKFIWGGDPIVDEIGPVVYHDFLEAALANGTFIPAPEAQVVGKGLENIQEAFAVAKKGVSAKKVVVEL